MLFKAILTGGVLSVLAGSIVYFGTEGADALDVNVSDSLRVEENALAGAADVAVGKAAVAEVDVQDPPAKASEPKASEPKTKWLDQYLKKSKPEPKSEPMVETMSEPVEDMVDEEPMVKPMVEDMDKSMVEDTDKSMVEDTDKSMVETKDKPRVRVIKRITSNSGSAQASGTYVDSKTGRVETIDIKEDFDIDILKDELGLDADKNIKIRVIRKMDDGKSITVLDTKTQRVTDYAPILVEAKKLLVTDMRNQAFLEIVDHAVDQGDMIQAADIIEELSTPELRDTARARIGTGLARLGRTEAAFAVLEEIEIDELAAPIRLEIITALMATQQERNSFTSQR